MLPYFYYYHVQEPESQKFTACVKKKKCMKQWWSRWYGGLCRQGKKEEERWQSSEWTQIQRRWLGILHHVCFHVLKKADVSVWMPSKKSKLTFCLLMLLCIFFICLWLWTETYCIVAYLPSCLKFAIGPAVRLKGGSSRKVRVIHRYSYLLKEQIVANACTH